MRYCIKILSKMGRICKASGYLFIIYHLNLHVQDAIKWLDQVVISGLSLMDVNGDGTQAATKNKVEIHPLYFNLSVM